MSAPGFLPLEGLPAARRRITAVLLTHGWERMDIEEMLADFAGELAEEIRKERDHMRDEMSALGGLVTQDTLNTMSYTANIIDPQGHEGARPDEEPTT
ncbi:hypothetical protein OOK36_55140 [Streptomyces sp. NBC_00365]|uniref:hypothetical protein n=1 Tax=Streptomyces sp. NBC_00365 TaxID=2975726 RepID=UPI0022552BB8|nr:hypothetical protein [Streptomyces sp. NBC_00365]MCX5097591.1 hypothetical protein [Streptomyces sp. NBC_00365]